MFQKIQNYVLNAEESEEFFHTKQTQSLWIFGQNPVRHSPKSQFVNKHGSIQTNRQLRSF